MNKGRAIVIVVAIAAGLSGIAWQRSALSDLREENRRLRDHTAAAERMARENGDIPQLRVENEEIRTLRTETRDLHKLRNEVRQLREQVKGLAQVRNENQRLRISASRTNTATTSAAVQPPVTLDQVSFMGMETPEATLQSFLWAVRQEDIQTFRNCLTPERQAEMASRSEDMIREYVKGLKSQMNGLRIAARKDVSADEVQLGLLIYAENLEPHAESKAALSFKRIGNQWRLDVAP